MSQYPRYSSALLVLLVVSMALCSCSSSPVQRYSASLHTRRLIARYGILDSSRTHPYLSQLARRLGNAESKQQTFPEIILLDAEDAFAFSGTPPSILLSRGLLRLLKSEDELAFIVAHEFAHTALDHTKRLEESGDPESVNLKALELEADQYAAEMLLRAGYQGDSIPLLLVRAHDALHSAQSTASHPELSLRIARVQEAMAGQQQLPTYPSRGFSQFIRSLPHSPVKNR